MSFVKNDPCRTADLVAATRGVDHHQCVVCDNNVGVDTGPCGAFDEAFLVMRASGIDALAAPVGQRGRTVAAEQGWQPARQIAANHITVFGIGCPARDQMRERRGTSGEAALQRVFEV